MIDSLFRPRRALTRKFTSPDSSFRHRGAAGFRCTLRTHAAQSELVVLIDLGLQVDVWRRVGIMLALTDDFDPLAAETVVHRPRQAVRFDQRALSAQRELMRIAVLKMQHVLEQHLHDLVHHGETVDVVDLAAVFELRWKLMIDVDGVAFAVAGTNVGHVVSGATPAPSSSPPRRLRQGSSC